LQPREDTILVYCKLKWFLYTNFDSFMLSNQQTSHASEKQIIEHNDHVLYILRSRGETSNKDKRPCYSVKSCIKLIERQNEMLSQNMRNPSGKESDYDFLDDLRNDSYSDDTFSSSSSKHSSSMSSPSSFTLLDVIKMSQEKKESKKRAQQSAKRKKKKKEKDFVIF